ncbi:hypothetical protein BDM02DRAFT_1674030 [Thelephora ganbajun]|uniref:Uncharacterized protein n=1 Tax=Thelephora ganbajun TaxID=370292 RepID=A0ACB6ZX86_THEGA|nr:hypothetical protein BDM02DRAFT_1674030 [Thelephora ganbajun]
MNSHTREPPPAQLPEANGPPPRQNGHGPDPAGRSRNSESQPPSGPGGRRGRVSESRKPPRTEPMDVDPPAPAHPPSMQESRSKSNVIGDRDDTKGDLPRGPKAMTSKLPPAPQTSLPPKPTTVSGRYSGRSPPPHLIAHDEISPQRASDRTIVDSHSDRHRDTSREHHNSEVAPPRGRSPDSRRPPTAPIPKLSGTNNVLIVRSRYHTSTPPIPGGIDEPRQDRIVENKQPLSNALTRQTRHERSAIPERAQTHIHELPDRPPQYQGPPALECRDSNRSCHERTVEQSLDRRGPNNPRAENYPENQLPPGAKVIYERPPSPLSSQHEREQLEVSVESRTNLEARQRNITDLQEFQSKSDRPERVRIDRERALRQEDRQWTRNDGDDEGRRRTDTPNHRVPLERRLSYERRSYSPNELPPPSPPSHADNREDYDYRSTSGYDDRNYGRGSERTRTPSPPRHHNPPQQFRGPRAYDDGGDGRRPQARPRSPNSDVGDRDYGKAEVRSTMSSRGGSLLDRLSTGNRASERDREDRFDDRGSVTDVNMTPNGQEPAGERRDNGKRRRRAKGGRR